MPTLDCSASGKSSLRCLVWSTCTRCRLCELHRADQRMHTRSEVDTAALFEQVQRDVMPIAPQPGTNMSASFGHLAGGYGSHALVRSCMSLTRWCADASYYGYLWSEVYSMDMFAARFLKEGILNPLVGESYRQQILRVGGSRDSADSLHAFLGRAPTAEAFLISKGLAV